MQYIYIMTNKRNGTLYTGVTVDLVRRVWEHKTDATGGFTKKHGLHTLVYFEECDDEAAAVEREKQVKRWKRQWKLELIEEKNPDWQDLYQDIV